MANIDRAVSLLSRLGQVESISSPVTSRAWGYDSTAEFLNVGVNLQTECDPAALLVGLKLIERQIAPYESHRDAEGRYADRTIDLDIITYGAECVQTPELTVPHALMSQRDFVLRPLAEILPSWRHPKLGVNAAEMLEKIQ